jgi:hypothetical protein
MEFQSGCMRSGLARLVWNQEIVSSNLTYPTNFMNDVSQLLQGILDKHASRKNALTYGAGHPCDCEDFDGIRKVIRELEKSGCSRSLRK